ncbi:hypothetical protein [Zymomonas mobilis]|uniref:hypothetical protein n=1 Tax=Zymomonas mobilis TaxID=542 RepID=UPI0021C30F8A|nr:hypothetical protein [Zymomonas mobilis]MCP9308593.1 hypothetical protein [Zymomonas mobilis]
MPQDRLSHALNRLSQALIRLEEADHRRIADHDIAARYQKLREATEQALARIDSLLSGNIQESYKSSFPTKEDREKLADSLSDAKASETSQEKK